jgi:nucleotide-binding universal stress UspA family protein
MAFKRVLVAFDGSPASERALDLAPALRATDGRLRCLTVAETYYATHAGMDAAAWDARIRGEAHDARDQAAARLTDVANAETAVVSGYAEPALLAAADQFDADLIALGSHGHSRVAGILLGSVATRLVHDATCSVLIARGSGDASGFPVSIVVGVDASPSAAEADAVAHTIGASSGASIRSLSESHPVEALVEASRSTDLVVVGSRGVHGLAALGSVAERVAHEAACSVLVVRSTGPRPPRR